MSNTTKSIVITYGSTSKSKDIKVDLSCSWHTCQLWFNKNMKKDFLAGKYGDRLNIKWHTGHVYEFKLRVEKE
jgi:hypothetical protein